MVEFAIRLVVRCQSSRSATNASRRSEVSRETGVSASARARSEARSGAGAASDRIMLRQPSRQHERGWMLTFLRAAASEIGATLCDQAGGDAARAVVAPGRRRLR